MASTDSHAHPLTLGAEELDLGPIEEMSEAAHSPPPSPEHEAPPAELDPPSPPGDPPPSHALYWGLPASIRAEQAAAAEQVASAAASDVASLLAALGVMPADAVLAMYASLDTSSLYGALRKPGRR